MISLVEKAEDQQRMLKLCEKTAYGCKISAVAGSYGFDKGFACFWLDPRSEVIYCLTDGVMIISGTVVEPEETVQFFHAVGPHSVMCAVRNAEALGLRIEETGDVLKKQLPSGSPALKESGEVNIREIYGLLEETGMAGEFEPFYLDLSHRLRHGTALAVTERRENELAGCAIVSAISGNAAILSALAVREPFRRQGLGSSLVARVEKSFPGKTLYVFRDKENNREFYKKLEYTRTDTWVHSAV